MVMDMRLLVMLRLFLGHTVVMAMDKLAVIVGMGMPVGAMLPLAAEPVLVSMRDVKMIVRVRHSRMAMLA